MPESDAHHDGDRCARLRSIDRSLQEARDLNPGLRQKIGCKTIRPYAMNAMRRPSTPLKMMGATTRYLTCTPTNTRLSTAKTVAARIVSGGCQWNAAGTMSPTVQTSSRMHRAIQAFRGKAPKDGTSLLTLSTMKTFMTPD